jgi:hypothetical protein
MTDEEARLTALTGENVPAVDAYYKEEVWSPKKASRDVSGCPFHADES